MPFKLIQNRNIRFNISNVCFWFITIGVFSERYIEFIIIVSICLLMPFLGGQIAINRKILYTFLVVFIASFISISLNNYVYGRFIQQFILILFYVICYYNIFLLIIKRSSIQEIFNKYLFVAHWVCVLGVLQFSLYFLFNIDILMFLYREGGTPVVLPRVMRIYSIVDEPGYLSTLLTPAFVYYYYSKNFNITISVWRKRLVYIVIFLTFSSATYLIIILVILYKWLMLSKKKNVKYIRLMSVSLLGLLIPLVMTSFRESENNVFKDVFVKFEDTFTAFRDMDPIAFEKLNLSSYSTMVNIWVAINAPNRLLGTGLGTHEQNYTSLYKSDFQYYGLNMDDGYSLFNRVYSEFGIVGISFLLCFIFRKIDRRSIINLSVFFYWLLS